MLLVASLLACASPTALKQAEYARILADPSPSHGVAACGALSDPELRGDCALAHATRKSPEAAAGQLCPQVPEGRWRDECWFQAAEEQRARGRRASAVSLCGRAGQYKADCGQHLWQTQVHHLIHKRGPSGFAEALPAARRIHDRWSLLLADFPDFDQRFWERFFQNGFEGWGVDLTACDVLDDADLSQRCVDAGVAAYDRDLAPALDRAGIDLCALDPADSTTLSRWASGHPDPRLDAVVEVRVQETCYRR